jgi:formate hydrogenlyase subunit 3/multisubunit Na+/H+ antiporter MnhD subunit
MNDSWRSGHHTVDAGDGVSSSIIQGSFRQRSADMIAKLFVIAMLIAIFASLFSALVFLFRDKKGSHRTAKALTWRIALSITLFVLLMASFYFGIIPPQGLSAR